MLNSLIVAAASAALLAPAAGPGVAAEITAVEPDDVTVTLITGDQVVLPDGDPGAAWVRPGEGRDDVEFRIEHTGDILIVTPEDALEPLAEGAIDPRLFNVTKLIEYGYDDSALGTIPIIADSGPAPAGNVVIDGLLVTAGALVNETLDELNLSTAEVDKDDAPEFWSVLTGADVATQATTLGVDRLWLDGVRYPMLDESVGQVGATYAWDVGLDGSGVEVAVLDSGIDVNHPDLAGRVVKSKNFTGEPGDRLGHGTHVASILAGSGASSNGAYKGVAPGARIINAKVCTKVACPESGILKAMEWATVTQKARIVNISLGDSDTPGIDPLEAAVNRLTKKTGALFVAAAGNGGADDIPVISPASADAALAVGAVDGKGKLAPFSARGPRVDDAALKPDITAPGVGIKAARGKGTSYGRVIDGRYTRVNGTSMATPHVSGAAAILAQQHPAWRAAELKAALMQSAQPNPDLSAYEQGAGLLDIAAATKVRLRSEPASVSLRQVTPTGDGGTVMRKITYHNPTADTLLLRLSVHNGTSGRAQAPRGMFRVDRKLLIVAPHSSAATHLTARPAAGGQPGHYSGWVTAEARGRTIITPFAS